AFAALALMATAAGCGNSESGAPLQQTAIVNSQGILNKPAILRTINTTGSSSELQLTAVRYDWVEGLHWIRVSVVGGAPPEWNCSRVYDEVWKNPSRP